MTFWENDNVIKNDVMVSDERIGADDRLSVVEKATMLIIDDIWLLSNLLDTTIAMATQS